MDTTRTERWLPIPTWEGVYEVSDHGNVNSVSRIVIHKNGTLYRKTGRTLATKTQGHGYLHVSLKQAGRVEYWGVHRLVALAFIGSCPPGLDTCHNNGDPTDNRPENLRYDTRSANMQDAIRHGNNHQLNKTHCPRGHELVKSNLTPSTVKVGGRGCLACSRARGYIQKRANLRDQFQSVSDSYYAKIMGATK